MRVKLSKSDWRKVGHKMGWLKKKAHRKDRNNDYSKWNRKLEFIDEKITHEGINFICDYVVTDVSEEEQGTQDAYYDMQISEVNYRIDRSNGHNPFGMEHDADVFKKLLEDDEDFFRNLEIGIEVERMDEFIEQYKERKREAREWNY